MLYKLGFCGGKLELYNQDCLILIKNFLFPINANSTNTQFWESKLPNIVQN